MLIDYLTERYCFSQAGLIVSVLLYFAASLTAVFFHRLGQARVLKKEGTVKNPLGTLLWGNLAGDLWGIFFFLLTGCLRCSYKESLKSSDDNVNKAVYWKGILWSLMAAAISYFAFTLIQIGQIQLGGLVWELLLFTAKAITCANISLLLFSLLPLPCSEGEVLLRKKPFSQRGLRFRKNGTLPFFLFCLLGLLLACVAISFPNGQTYSVSGILTLFPILVVGG